MNNEFKIFNEKLTKELNENKVQGGKKRQNRNSKSFSVQLSRKDINSIERILTNLDIIKYDDEISMSKKIRIALRDWIYHNHYYKENQGDVVQRFNNEMGDMIQSFIDERNKTNSCIDCPYQIAAQKKVMRINNWQKEVEDCEDKRDNDIKDITKDIVKIFSKAESFLGLDNGNRLLNLDILSEITSDILYDNFENDELDNLKNVISKNDDGNNSLRLIQAAIILIISDENKSMLENETIKQCNFYTKIINTFLFEKNYSPNIVMENIRSIFKEPGEMNILHYAFFNDFSVEQQNDREFINDVMERAGYIDMDGLVYDEISSNSVAGVDWKGRLNYINEIFHRILSLGYHQFSQSEMNMLQRSFTVFFRVLYQTIKFYEEHNMKKEFIIEGINDLYKEMIVAFSNVIFMNEEDKFYSMKYFICMFLNISDSGRYENYENEDLNRISFNFASIFVYSIFMNAKKK